MSSVGQASRLSILAPIPGLDERQAEPAPDSIRTPFNGCPTETLQANAEGVLISILESSVGIGSHCQTKLQQPYQLLERYFQQTFSAPRNSPKGNTVSSPG
jgi:hypothetical protein